MQYQIKKIVEEIDVIDLTPEEYKKINTFYAEVIAARYPSLEDNKQIYDVRRMVLSDELSRVEVIINVDGKLPPRSPPKL